MGATTWNYFAPYDEDVKSVLQRLRQVAFTRGDYAFGNDLTPEERQAILGEVRPELDPWIQKCREIAADLPESLRALYVETAEQIKRDLLKPDALSSPPKRKPKTIEDLLEAQGENGTHSILDIQRVSDEPASGAVSPMPAGRLREIFGTDKPTRDMVEGKLGDYDLVEDPLVSERWQGVYFTVYREGKPDQLFLWAHLEIDMEWECPSRCTRRRAYTLLHLRTSQARRQ